VLTVSQAEALVAEVERLREMLLNAGWPREADELAALALRYERAAVVAYLRGKFPEWPAGTNGFADEVEPA
jgi:hypothetical protein